MNFIDLPQIAIATAKVTINLNLFGLDTPHAEIYRIAWYEHYQKLINDLAYHPFFNRLIIKSTVINTHENRVLLKTALIKIIKSHSRVKETVVKIKKTA